MINVWCCYPMAASKQMWYDKRAGFQAIEVGGAVCTWFKQNGVSKSVAALQRKEQMNNIACHCLAAL